MSREERSYPDPDITVENQRFWDAARRGHLLLGKCRECGKHHYYPRAVCPYCLTTEVDWVPAAGTGRIYSFSIMRRAEVPYAIAYVTLDEGVSVMSNIVDAEFDALAIDQPVKLAFRKTESGHALPVFAPA